MKLSLQSPQLRDIRSVLDVGFLNADLPGEDELARAWADPRIQALLKPPGSPELGKLLQSVAVEAFAQVQGRVGLNVGVPSNALSGFAASIAADALDDGVVNWANFATQGTKAISDIALTTMGQIPIVGWLAELAHMAVSIVIALANKNKPKPLFLRYEKDADQRQARQALESMTVDWTGLFLPAWSGSWDTTSTKQGYVLHPKTPTGYFGCLPGGATGFVTQQISEKATEDTWDQTPSVARVCAAAWSAISTNETASVFNVKPWEWTAWYDYFDRGLNYNPKKIKGAQYQEVDPFKALHKHLSKSSIPLAWPRLKHSKVPARIRGEGFVPRAKGLPAWSYQNLVEAWINLIAQRQVDMLATPVCAYASEKQVAFVGNSNLRAMLVEYRKQLLSSSDAAKVNPNDVVDADFRQALVDTGFRQGGSRPLPGRPQRTPPMAPLRPSSGTMAFVAASLAAGVLYWAWKTR